MNTKAGTLSDEDVLAKVEVKARESVSWYDSRLSRERERVVRYYNGELPKRQHEGASSYVSTDVYDATEMLKSQLLETFAGGEDIAQFDPDQDMSISDCLVATKYASYVIFRENEGFSIFNDVIHDGLTARVGIAQVWWEEKYDYNEETFEGLDHASAMGLAAQEDIDEFDGTQQPDGSYKGTLVRKIDKCGICIETVAPEEFLIAPRSISIPAASYKGRRTLKTRAELIGMGFDKNKVDRVQYDDGKSLELSPEVLSRNRPIETAQAVDEAVQPQLEKVMYYESYVKMVIEPSKGARLYKICHAGSVLLDKQEVDRAPYIPYVPLPVPHMFYGNNFAARVIPTQNARTVLTRGVLDHTVTTTNPRWQVVSGGLLSPKELLENRLGGLVNVRRPDSVLPLPQAPLNQFVLPILEMLKEDKEQSTGISALSQGLNKDALSKQNSQGLVDNMISVSMTREKVAARQFAYNFFVPLMIEVVRLAILHQKKAKVIEVAGQPIQINPQQWSDRTSCTVSMHLGYGEKDQAVAKHAALYQSLSQDPSLETMFGMQQRYNLITDTAKLGGINKISAYLARPDQVQPPQPDPLKVQEIQNKTTMSQAAQTQAQSSIMKEQRQAVYDQQKLKIDAAKLHMQALDQDHTQERLDYETANRINVAQREAKINEKMFVRESRAPFHFDRH